jgi:hypothetical protein
MSLFSGSAGGCCAASVPNVMSLCKQDAGCMHCKACHKIFSVGAVVCSSLLSLTQESPSKVNNGNCL